MLVYKYFQCTSTLTCWYCGCTGSQVLLLAWLLKPAWTSGLHCMGER